MPSEILGPLFLSKERVIEIQKHQIERYGGIHGIRDEEALESAVFMPQQTYGADFLHTDLFEMAAAYAFHISEGQPFNDGNKRTGMAASLLFLHRNSVKLLVDQGEFGSLIRRVSIKEATKADIADYLRFRFN